uniref:CWF19-like protein 1 n=1 Tax=Anthurium amnicola TaxID=1678845 RepID=A0A1D1Y4Y0_9ARAE
MEAERKRKRPSEDGEGRRRRTGRDAGKPSGGREGDGDRPGAEDDVEDQVEEFFAIVHRMQAATRQLAGSGARQPPRVEEEPKGLCRWRPAFEWEDFQEGSHPELPRRVGEVASPTSAPIPAVGGCGGKREERTAENGIPVLLDLNAEPEPEQVLG